MTGRDPIDPPPDEAARGLDALRELTVEALPADVLARLEGRLEGELGRPAPVRRRRRLPRLALVMPGAGVALGAAVLVAVLVTNGGSGTPPQQHAALSARAKAAVPGLQETATAGGAAADSSAQSSTPAPSTFAAKRVTVPALVGRRLAAVRSTTRARGLTWIVGDVVQCQPGFSARVTSQLPEAGARVPAGTAVRVSLGTCAR
jgi:PASTA domain